MRMVGASRAHGNVVSIDTSAAKATKGVVAVWTAADIADVPPVDFREGRIERLEPWRQPVLATDRVRYVGEPVAAGFAADPYVAEDAADLVTIEVAAQSGLLHAPAGPAGVSPRRHT